MNEIVAFAKLLAEINPLSVTNIMMRLKRPTALTKAVTAVVDQHLKVAEFHTLTLAESKKFLRQPNIAEIIELANLHDVPNARAVHYIMKSSFVNESNLRPTPLLTGDDLKRLGFVPGPEFKTILEAVEEAQLNDELLSQRGAEAFVLKRYSK